MSFLDISLEFVENTGIQIYGLHFYLFLYLHPLYIILSVNVVDFLNVKINLKVKQETGRTWADRMSPIRSRLGSKREAYYSDEKEMLSSKLYIYETLSESEQEIYNQRHNMKFKKDAEIYKLPIIITKKDLEVEKDYLCYYNEAYWKKYKSINKQIKTTENGN